MGCGFTRLESADDFRFKILESGGRALVYFYNDWNRECAELNETLQMLCRDAAGAAEFYSVDGNNQAEIMAWMRIINTPMVILFEKGRAVRRVTGVHEESFYLSMLGLHSKPDSTLRDTFSDTWIATDALGRDVAGYAQAGPPRGDKYVAMFYFISYGEPGTDGPHDVTKILESSPDAEDTPASPPWGGYTTHHWGESIFGYYLNTDDYVLRKHAQMLSDAMVDVIVFDLSNVQDTDPPGAYFKETWTKVFEVFSSLRSQGRRTPQIAFLLNFWAGPHAVGHLYDDLYKPQKYRDLWFLWEGKPLILYDRGKVARPEILNFFTFRRPMPDYFYGPAGPDQWSWSEIYPQHGFRSAAEPERVEEVSVSVAQNAVPDGCGGWTLGCMSARDEQGRYLARGRSFSGGKQPETYDSPRGINFAEQIGRVFELDPKLVFITGWNEWVAGRMSRFMYHEAPTVLVDQYNEEFSRDLEPAKGRLGDNYYLQFVDFVRRFKGVRPQTLQNGSTTIDIVGGFEQWDAVDAVYLDDEGDTLRRSFPGYGNAGPYVDDSGRNDFVLLKVACDSRYVYFFAQTSADITPHTDPDWMRLLIRTSVGESSPEGFQLLLNGHPRDENTTTAEVYAASSWQIAAEIKYRVSGSRLHLAVPRTLPGLGGSPLRFGFKWVDNIRLENAAEEFYTRGDTAPNGRFLYRYENTAF